MGVRSNIQGNDIKTGRSKICYADLDNTFSLFQLESKSYRTKQCWPYISYHIKFFLEFFNVQKTAYWTILLCFKKEPSLLPVLITELHCLPERQIKTNTFYMNAWNYPLMTYLTLHLSNWNYPFYILGTHHMNHQYQEPIMNTNMNLILKHVNMNIYQKNISNLSLMKTMFNTTNLNFNLWNWNLI